jgi:hypothetical protein
VLALPLAEVLPAGWQKVQRVLALPLAEVLPAGWQNLQRVLAASSETEKNHDTLRGDDK